MKNKFLNISLVAMTLSLSSLINIANAGLITFSDRTAFELALGTSQTEDFDSFVADTSFHPSSIDLDDFSIVVTGNDVRANYNIIDAPALVSSESDVNGSAHMRVFTNINKDLLFTFDYPTFGFGVDIASLNDGNRTRILIDGVDAILAINPGDFFGVISTEAFTSVTFQGIINDVYGIDNVTYSGVQVPEPSTLAIFALGMIGLVSRRFKKQS
ncbi:MAG: PEP-CTERM sorting domain-containing protein [Colwellia sp.]|nr:PEP-CTERM sorting domain-containing protein [Colwellia sp.]